MKTTNNNEAKQEALSELLKEHKQLAGILKQAIDKVHSIHCKADQLMKSEILLEGEMEEFQNKFKNVEPGIYEAINGVSETFGYIQWQQFRNQIAAY